MIDRRNDNRRWKTIDDLWKEAFDDNVAALTVTNDARQKDAFGRLRVSDTGQRLDVEFLYDKQDEYFDETTSNGTVTFNGSTRDLTLSLSNAANGSFAKMESYPVPYTPGNSQLIDITGVLDLAELGTGTAEVFLRTSISGSAVETAVEQTSWLNRVDDVDWSTSQIFTMDFQSLKVGTIRFGLVRDGAITIVHALNNDNVRNAGYWQIPNGPVYYKLYTTGGITYAEVGYGNEANAIGFRYKVTANASATMKAICCTVKSEGGRHLIDMPGQAFTANRGVTAKTISTTLVPLISIRPRSTFNTYENLVLSLPKSVSVQTTESIRLAVVHNGTLTGASWANVNTNKSTMEYDVAATVLTGGHIVTSDYIFATGSGANRGLSSQTFIGKTPMWYRQNSETGILTVAAIRTGASDASVLAGMSWEELR